MSDVAARAAARGVAAAADDTANGAAEEAFDVGMRQNAMEHDAHDVNRDTKVTCSRGSPQMNA